MQIVLCLAIGLCRRLGARLTQTFVLQEPFVKLGVVVRFRPGVMACVRIDGETDLTSQLLDGADHDCGTRHGYDVVLGTIEYPGRAIAACRWVCSGGRGHSSSCGR